MTNHNAKNADPADAAQAPIDQSRRAAVRMGLIAGAGLLLGGCASSGSRVSGDTPGVNWPVGRTPGSTTERPRVATGDRDWKRPEPWSGSTPMPSLPRNIKPRSAWAQARPIPQRMDRMLPARRITIHHDGMDPVSLRTNSDVAHRLEQIRQSHLTRDFGDIGYHFIIDPRGNVWEGRPLTWQGAHVGRQNENNIGVMCLGNFEVERPTSDQLDGLNEFVASLMRTYRIPVREVKTHRELASTACPGRYLQPHVNRVRRSSLAMVG